MIKWLATWYIKWICDMYGKVAKRMVEKGKGALFTNVVPFMGNISGEQLFSLFNVQKAAIAINSDQGPTILVHGTPEGKYQIGDDIIEIDDVVNIFQLWGIWNLVSCYNRFHTKLAGERYLFIKQEVINTQYPIIIHYDDKEKKMYCFSDKRALWFAAAVEWCKQFV